MPLKHAQKLVWSLRITGLTTWFAVDSRAWYKRHVLKNGRAENIGRGGFSAHRAMQAHFRGQAI